MRAALLVVTACGRLGFSPVSVEDDATLADVPVPLSVGEQLTCARTALVSVTDTIDQVFWVSASSGDFLITNHHITLTQHPYFAFELSADASAISAAPLGMLVDTADAFGEVLTTETGHLLIVNEMNAGRITSYELSGATIQGEPKQLTGVGFAQRPAARDRSGSIAAIGISASNDLVAMPVASDGTFVSAQVKILDGAVQQPELPTITALPSGFLVAWKARQTGRCRVARLASDLSIAAGPIDITFPHACDVPIAELVDGDRIVVAGAQGGGVRQLSFAMYDLALNEVVAPQTFDGDQPRLISNGDHAWLSYGDVTTLRVGWISRSGVLTQLPSPGTLPGGVPWGHSLGLVVERPVLLWGDADGTIAAMRLCR